MNDKKHFRSFSVFYRNRKNISIYKVFILSTKKNFHILSVLLASKKARYAAKQCKD